MEIENNSTFWALILGGSSGLGLATAKKLARHGYNIIILHRDRRADMDEIDIHFKEIIDFGVAVKTFNIDALNKEKRMTVLNDIVDFLPKGHKIKVLIHSIAKGSLKPMQPTDGESLSATDIQLTFEAMSLSLYEWSQDIIGRELFAPDSRIIAFTSEGNTRALANYAAVSVAKVALEALVRNMALEFAPIGIRANCIQAGVTKTKSFEMIPNSEQIEVNALERNPNNRLTRPEDVANAAYLLSLEEAKWITGTILKVDGGESLR